MMTTKEPETDFGFEQVPLSQKAQRVKNVFSSVAPQYDLMNDLMSFGLHRIWKRLTVAAAALQSDSCVLDLAGGTGDLTALMAKKITQGQLVLADINFDML